MIDEILKAVGRQTGDEISPEDFSTPAHVKTNPKDSIAHRVPGAAKWLLENRAEFIYSIATTATPGEPNHSTVEVWRVDDELFLLTIRSDNGGWLLFQAVEP